MANGNITDTETLAREMRKPVIAEVKGRPLFLIPEGYKAEVHEELLEQPVRKKGVIHLSDTESFITFIKREGSLATCLIYADVDYQRGAVKFTAVLNDNDEEHPHWRDYRAIYVPQKSFEWLRWTEKNCKVMSQVEFAQFLEDNNKDVASVEGMPTGIDILAMAANFESKQEIIIKSAILNHNGTVDFSYTDREDGATVERMKMFKQFALGLAPFFNGEGYRITARLRYRKEGGKLSFWYELDRPDVILEKAAVAMIKAIKDGAGFPFLFGSP